MIYITEIEELDINDVIHWCRRQGGNGYKKAAMILMQAIDYSREEKRKENIENSKYCKDEYTKEGISIYDPKAMFTHEKI